MRWVPRLADTSRVLHWDYNDIGVFEVPLELQHTPCPPRGVFPHKCYVLAACSDWRAPSQQVYRNQPRSIPPHTLRPLPTHCLCYKGGEAWTHTWQPQGVPEPTCAPPHVPRVQNRSTCVTLPGHLPCVECEDICRIRTHLWCLVSQNSSSADLGKVEDCLCVECAHFAFNTLMYAKPSRASNNPWQRFVHIG